MSDLISRQVAINALNDEYHGMISDESMKIYQIINWLNDLPSAEPETHEERTETHACDCISRQAAIDILHEALDAADQIADVPFGVYQNYRDKMNDLPSAQPVISCDGCRFVGTYDTDFPCRCCIRREKDYYEKE